MLILTTDRRTSLQARLTQIETRIASLEAAIETYYDQGLPKEYRFNSGEGSQWVMRPSLEKLEETVDILYRRKDHIEKLLNGRGNLNFTLRRR